MKKILITIAVSIITAVTAHAAVVSAVGPASFKVTAITQGEDFALISSKTNSTATTTNTTQVFKSTINKAAFGNTNLLALIENSLNTNFPAGSQIGFRFSQLVIVDHTGTNVIFVPSSVCNVTVEEEVISGMETEIVTQNSSGESVAGNSTEVFTISAILVYDDTLLATGDATHTTFQFKGLMTINESVNLKTRLTKISTQFQGTGGGPIRGVETILTGTITVKAVGAPPGPV
jgi:hypothetical protein